jgi:hypothetical protein
MGQKENQYIHRLARTVAGQIGLVPERYFSCQSSSKFPFMLFNEHGGKIAAIVAKWTPETCGKIAACGLGGATLGQTSLCGVHGRERWLNGSLDGNALLRMMALTAIIAAMADNVRARYRERDQRVEEEEALAQLPPPTPHHPDTVALIRRHRVEVSGNGMARVRRPTLDQYDAHRDKTSDGGLVPYQGSTGKYFDE